MKTILMKKLFKKQADYRSGLIIVGTGFSGSSVAYNINRSLIPNVTMIEAQLERILSGNAYSEHDNTPLLQTNTPAGAMSIDLKDPNHFSERPIRANPLEIINAKVTDVEQRGRYVRARFDDGKIIEGRHIVVATGNSMKKKLPCVTPDLIQNPLFSNRYMDGMSLSERYKVDIAPERARVLVIGTLLSGDDATRTLMRHPNVDHVTMVSRSGYRHEASAERITPPDHNNPKIPTPKFLVNLLAGENNRAVVGRAVSEFYSLTGYHIDLDTGEIEKDMLLPLQRKFGFKFRPDEVLVSWEKNFRKFYESIGAKQTKEILSKYSSLLNSLRVNAGHQASAEIKEGMRQGRIDLKAANVLQIQPKGDCLSVMFQDRHGDFKTEDYDLVCSALGPRYDYHKKGTDPVMTALLNRGYTEPHDLGLGVNVKDNYTLPYASRISVMGPATTGHRMLEHNLTGPFASSVPAIKRSLGAVMGGIYNQRLPTHGY
jgi:uncharacterized NAD(P)/FAD-binding protein YdhS